jgi:hypothetical protein
MRFRTRAWLERESRPAVSDGKTGTRGGTRWRIGKTGESGADTWNNVRK